MRLAVIGAGNVGSTLARATMNAGHDVTIAAPSGDFERVRELQVATTTSNGEAVKDAEVVILAVPFGAVGDLVTEVGDLLDGKIVIDVTNPLKPDLSGLVTEGTSAAEMLQQRLSRARVVKAFNTVLAANQANPTVDGTQLDGFAAGDDEEAKKTVLELLATIGYRPIDAGPLSADSPPRGDGFLKYRSERRERMGVAERLEARRPGRLISTVAARDQRRSVKSARAAARASKVLMSWGVSLWADARRSRGMS